MAKYVYEQDEHLFYFCCNDCKNKFEADPQYFNIKTKIDCKSLIIKLL